MLQVVLSRTVLVIVAVLLEANLVAAVPLVLSHQGRLLDASDHPLSGTYTIIYSIHDAAVGGSQLWMEDHVGVVVTDGLFSVVLGSTVPLTADIVAGNGGGGGGGGAIRFLQVQLSGQPPISPRTPLSSSPYSVATQRVSGDVETLPGEMIIHCTACSAVDGITLSSDVDSDDLSMVRLNGLPPGTPYIGRVAVSSSSSQSSIGLGDLDADGALDMHCGPDSTVFDLGSGENGTLVSSYRAKAGKTGATKRMSYSSGGSTSSIDEDCDDVSAGIKVLNVATSNSQGWSLRCKPDSIVNEERISDGRADVVLYKATTGKTGRAKQSLFMVPGGGTTESDEDCNATGSSLKLRFDSTPARISTNMTVGKQSSRLNLDADLDGDGSMENSCLSVSDSVHSGVTVSSRFGSGPRQTTSMDGSFSHSHMRCDSDSDDDGVADNSVVSEASSSGSSLRVLSLNGLPPGEPVLGNIVLSTDGSSSSIAVNEEGIECTMSGTVAGPVSPPQGRVRVAVGDVNGDGISDMMCSPDSVNENNSVLVDGSLMSSYTAKQGSTGRTKRCAAFALDGSRSTDDELVSISSGVRRKLQAHNLGSSGQDGVSDLRCTPDSIVAENSISSDGELKSLLYTAKQGKTGSASGKRTISPSGDTTSVEEVCDTTGVSLKLNIDSTPARLSTNFTVGKQSSRILQAADVDGDGSADYSSESSCDGSSAKGQLTGVAPGTSNISAVSFEVDATGPFVSLTQDGTVFNVMNGDGNVLRSSSNVVVADLDRDGNLFLASNLSVGASGGTHHIDVAGGAYCDGTNWVNASDENSKENFEQVDGEELLERISGLEITKWNYKGDTSAEHIGPTAQDFKKTFGVGADDKSISTIDPSGIALAAIKELYSQLKSKDKEMDEQLKARDKQIAELREQVVKLQRLINKN